MDIVGYNNLYLWPNWLTEWVIKAVLQSHTYTRREQRVFNRIGEIIRLLATQCNALMQFSIWEKNNGNSGPGMPAWWAAAQPPLPFARSFLLTQTRFPRENCYFRRLCGIYFQKFLRQSTLVSLYSSKVSNASPIGFDQWLTKLLIINGTKKVHSVSVSSKESNFARHDSFSVNFASSSP